MTENKTRKPYVRPSMEVIKVETTSILAGSPGGGPEMSATYSNDWGDGGTEDIGWDSGY